MKNGIIAFSAASVHVISLIIIATFKAGIVAALTATSTSATSTDVGAATTLPDTASSTPSSTARYVESQRCKNERRIQRKA